MTPEARAHLDKALEDLDDAEKMIGIGLSRAAARSAYYSAFHAAEALIVERTAKVAKSHSGVRTEFARLLKDGDPAVACCRRFWHKPTSSKNLVTTRWGAKL